MFDRESQYPNEVSSWAMDYLNHQLPDFDLSVFNKFIDNCKRSGDSLLFLKAPLFQNPVEIALPNVPVVNNGDVVNPIVVPPVGGSTTVPAVKAPGKAKAPYVLGACDMFLKTGKCTYPKCKYKHIKA
jgi:hypothetical protein